VRLTFDQVRLLQSMIVGLRRRVECHGTLKIVDSAVENVVGRLAESLEGSSLAGCNMAEEQTGTETVKTGLTATVKAIGGVGEKNRLAPLILK
jgi:hypothetical protein